MRRHLLRWQMIQRSLHQQCTLSAMRLSAKAMKRRELSISSARSARSATMALME
jgi:hypothetical protein